MADVRGYAYQHRLKAAEKAGRMLLPGEIAHHDNEVKTDNSDRNIILESSIAAHKVHHRKPGSKLRLPGEENPTIICKCGCGKTLLKYDDAGRPRTLKKSHSWRKGTGRRNSKEMTLCACGCGTQFLKYDKYGRERHIVLGHYAKSAGVQV